MFLIRLIGWMLKNILRLLILLAVLAIAGLAVMHFTPLDEFYRAKGHAQLGDYQEAERHYNLGLQKYPQSRWAPVGHYELGLILYQQGRYAKSIAHLNKALTAKLSSDIKKQALLKIADCFERQKQWKEAARRYDLIWQNYGDDYQLAARAKYRAAACYQNAGRKDVAAKRFRAVVSDHPTSQYAPKALFAVAQILEQKRAYERALADYRALVQRYPESDEAVQAKLRIAEIFRQQGKKQEALSAYLELVKSAPKLLRTAVGRQIVEQAKRQLWALREKLKEKEVE